MRIYNQLFLTAGDMAGSVTSSAEPLDYIYGFSIQAIYTGSPVGTLTLEASNDNSNWVTVTDSSYSVTSAGNYMWNFTVSNFKWVRVVYTRTSGTGTLSARIYARGN